MKMISLALIVFFFAMGLQVQAATGGGFDHDNGGDTCENQFKNIRDNLAAWISKGGAKNLRFPNGITYEQYLRAMLVKMSTAKINCTDKKILVGGAEKTCKNFSAADGTPSIQCNQPRFMATSTSEQYILVHHEYAGLAGFEVNRGADSNYVISNQIIRYLTGMRIELVRMTLQFISKAAVQPEVASSDRAKKNNAICMFIGRINQGDITQELYRDLVSIGGNSADDVLPVSLQTFQKLRLNIMGLQNYCYQGFVPDDPQPLTFEDGPGLLRRISHIERQLLEIERYLDQRVPYKPTP